VEQLSWGHLAVSVGPNVGFYSWGFGVAPGWSWGGDSSSGPDDERAAELTTPEGTGFRTTVDEFGEIHGPVEVDDYTELYDGLVLHRAPAGYVGYVQDGVLLSIHAAVGDQGPSGVFDVCSAFD